MQSKNHYETLCLKPTRSVDHLNYYDYSKEQVEKAAKKARIKWHPDHNKSADATARLQEIGEALSILGNPLAKRDYDEQLRNPHGTPYKSNILQDRKFEYNKFGIPFSFSYQCPDEVQNTFPFEETFNKLFVEVIQLGYIEYKILLLLKSISSESNPKIISNDFFIKRFTEGLQKEFSNEVCNDITPIT